MNAQSHRLLAAILVVGAAALVGSCIRTYKIDIQQGNTVTSEQLAELEPGMSKREVRFIMGSPVVEDPFHDERWVYYYSFRPGRSRTRDQQVLTLVFDDEFLSYVDGDLDLEIVDVKTLELLNPEDAQKKGFFSRLFKRGGSAAE